MTWIQTSKGRAFDLLNPTPEMVDLKVYVAEALARIPRFGGHVMSGPYSVAQHSVIGANLLGRQGADIDTCAAFLLHDAHEAYIGDISTPAQDALNWHLQMLLDEFGLTEVICRNIPALAGPALLKRALRRLKGSLDEAIFAAAGIAWPLPYSVTAAVHKMDLIMLAAEVDAFMGGELYPWGATVEVRATCEIPDLTTSGIWSADRAERSFQYDLRQYLPGRFPNTTFED